MCLLPLLFLVALSLCSNEPPFHNLPLGSHIQPDPVDEVTLDDPITPREFAEKYVFPRKPVVFRGIVKSWPAYSKWTDEYLKTEYGGMEMRLEGRKEKSSGTPQGDVCLGRDTMKNFIETYRHGKGANKYIVSEVPTPMYRDLKIPPVMNCGGLKETFVEVDIWMNSGGARSLLHKDAFNTMSCMVNGSKEWKLIELQYNDYVYQAWESPQDAGWGGYSLIDPERVDMTRFPKVGEIPRWQHVMVNAGDCLHLPSQMWHQVTSYGDQNLAVTFLFEKFQERDEVGRITTADDLNLASCGKDVTALPLDQVDVDWQYPGTGRMSMGFSRIDSHRAQLPLMFNKKGHLSLKRLFLLIVQAMSGIPYAKVLSKPRALALFDLLNGLSPSGKMTVEEAATLSREQMRKVIPYLEPHEPASTYEHEYSYFSPRDIEDMVFRVAESSDSGVVRKDHFVRVYVDMNGSEKFALDTWQRLAGSAVEITLAEAKEGLVKACELYELYRRYAYEEEDVDPEDRIDVPATEFKSQPKRMQPDFPQTGEESVDAVEQEKNVKTEL